MAVFLTVTEVMSLIFGAVTMLGFVNQSMIDVFLSFQGYSHAETSGAWAPPDCQNFLAHHKQSHRSDLSGARV